jgi:archaeosine-15-forming tRNA-guanine transglycosylase
MSKYILSFDESDVMNGAMIVDKNGCLKAVGKVILTSPNGKRWTLTVNNDGTMSAQAISE